MFLLGNQFSLEEKRRNFDYYDPLTTGDSSLSVSVQSISGHGTWLSGQGDRVVQVCRLDGPGGYPCQCGAGLPYRFDGRDLDGVIYGVAGMRERHGHITFRPRLGQRIEGLRFHLTIQGQLLTVNIDGRKGQATYLLREGAGLNIGHLDEELELEPNKPVTRSFNPYDTSAIRACPTEISTRNHRFLNLIQE